MVACTFLHEYEKTKVSDKDLLELLLENDYIKERYVVIEREFYRPKKHIFHKPEKEIIYDVYYRYDMQFPFEVQALSCPVGFDYAATYMYFLGLINGIDDVRKGKVAL